MTDIEFIQGFRNNNNRVISFFYESTRRPFFSYFSAHYSKNESYIVDLFQEACTTLWRNIKRGKLTENSLTSSLFTYFIAVGRYTMMAKDRKYKEIVDDTELVKLLQIEDDADELQRQIEQDDFICRMVNEMKPPCNVILRAYYWDGSSGAEIADECGFKNADSVKSQKYKCIQKLKPLVEKFMKL